MITFDSSQALPEFLFRWHEIIHVESELCDFHLHLHPTIVADLQANTMSYQGDDFRIGTNVELNNSVDN